MGRHVSRRVAGAAGVCVAALIGATLVAAPAVAVDVPAAPFDFNGDGRRDLAIGSPDASVAGQPGAGLVSVVNGTAAGLDPDQHRVYSEFPESVPSDPSRGDRFGAALDSADFNRDGYADLVVGAPGEGGSTGPNEGWAFFALGGPSGFTGWQAVMFAPGNESDRYGESVAAGDLDGDGYPEAIIAAPGTGSLDVWTFAPAPGATAAATKPRRVETVPLPRDGDVSAQAVGAEFFRVDTGDVFGDAGQELVALWRDEQGADPVAQGHLAMLSFDGGEPAWTDPTPAIGHTLAVGDLDGDAPAEVAVGQYSDGGFTGGQVTVWQQGVAPTHLTGATRYNQDTANIPGVAEAGDRFGQSLAIGDADGDGRGDLAVGVPGEDLTGGADAGATVFLYGGAAGLDTARAWAINQETSNIPGGSEAGDRFGHAGAVLDFDADGKAELAAGSFGENGTEGRVTVLNGGLTSVGAIAFGPVTIGVTTTARLGSVLGR